MLKKGEVLAFKTDTVWGFGAHPGDDIAINKIYQIKKRDLNKPLILMSSDFKHLKPYIKRIPEYAYLLIDKYLPGGLTLVFEKSSLCSSTLSANKTTVGVRVPDSADFSILIEKIEGRVLATTSCNLSNEPPVVSYSEACQKFSNQTTIIKPIDDTKTQLIPSTVILCEDDSYKVLRRGKVKL